MDNRLKVSTALSSLLTRKNEDAFVIIEQAGTGKFVQFAGGAEEPLMLDLPSQTLSELEFHRAVKFFRERGVEVEELEMLDEPDGKVVGNFVTFNKVFESVDDATQAVLDVLSEIYEFPDECDIEIIEN